jgi:opacity protein-like surface antigen
MSRQGIRIQSMLMVMLLVLPVFSGAFIHPKQLLPNVQTTQVKDTFDASSSEGFNFIGCAYTSHPMAAYVNQDGGMVLHFGLINLQGLSGRLDVGYFSNKDGGGSMIKSIPIMGNILLGYPLQSRIDSYLGLGLGLIAFQDAVSKIGIGFQWFSGVTFGITSDMSLFTEYGRQYCSVDNQNLDAEMVKFGLTFKFFPR